MGVQEEEKGEEEESGGGDLDAGAQDDGGETNKLRGN